MRTSDGRLSHTNLIEETDSISTVTAVIKAVHIRPTVNTDLNKQKASISNRKVYI